MELSLPLFQTKVCKMGLSLRFESAALIFAPVTNFLVYECNVSTSQTSSPKTLRAYQAYSAITGASKRPLLIAMKRTFLMK